MAHPNLMAILLCLGVAFIAIKAIEFSRIWRRDMERQEELAVVPLVPVDATPSTDTMLRMVLNHEALLVHHVLNDSLSGRPGQVAQATGAFAKAISQVTGEFNRFFSTEGLYRVVLPAGSTAKDLVPAVGGGFRGMVKAAGSTRISGHATLLPAAGIGATVAAGPLIATVALATVSEMFAQHQQNKKLESIQKAVQSIQTRMSDEDRAVLVTAEQQVQKVTGYLLDRASIPKISSAPAAFGDLNTLANRWGERLVRWTETVQQYSHKDCVYGPELMLALTGEKEHAEQAFENMVAQTYEALALRARVVVLEKVAAESENQNRSLPHVEAALRAELSDIAAQQTQLTELIDDLSAMPLDSSKLPVHVAGRGMINTRTSFARLSKALHSTPSALPILDQFDRMILDAAPTSDGLSIITPEENTVSTPEA